MAFWSDRFRREDEEDIWEELKKMITNPPSEQEIAQKKQEEQAWIDSILDKAFPGKPKPQTESYLTYEDLLLPEDAEKYRQKQMALTQQKETTKRNPYEEINSRLDWSEGLKAQKRAEVAKIQETARQRERGINIESAKEHAKNFGGAALEIGSAAIPGYGGAKLAGAVAKNLAPKVGRKIAQEIATGTLKGASSGTVEGLGRGLLEDENLLKTTVQDTIVGAAGGAGLGVIGGNVQKAVRGKKLKQYGDIDMLDKTSRKQYSKDAREYYQDYNQGIIVNKDGPIEFTNRGQREVLRWNPKQAQNFPELTKDIKGAKKLPNMSNTDEGKIYTDHFDVYRGKLGDHLIEVNKNGNRRYYTTKDIPEGSLRAPSTGTFENANNIIPHSQSNLNSSNINTQTNLGQNLNQNNTIKPPKSDLEWLEEVKRKRKKLGWW